MRQVQTMYEPERSGSKRLSTGFSERSEVDRRRLPHHRPGYSDKPSVDYLVTGRPLSQEPPAQTNGDLVQSKEIESIISNAALRDDATQSRIDLIVAQEACR